MKNFLGGKELKIKYGNLIFSTVLFSVKTSQDTDSLIQAYIHQHVWMLFTLLAISMGDVIYTNEGNTSLSLDQEYTSLAAQLQNKCISISTHCLQQVPDDAEGKGPRWTFFSSEKWSYFCHFFMK